MLSETDSDSAVIPLDGVHYYALSNRNNDDVVILGDNHRTDGGSTSARGESNYVRDETTSSNSETSTFGDFYARPACRLVNTAPLLIQVVDSFGFSRDILPGSSSIVAAASSVRIHHKVLILMFYSTKLDVNSSQMPSCSFSSTESCDQEISWLKPVDSERQSIGDSQKEESASQRHFSKNTLEHIETLSNSSDNPPSVGTTAECLNIQPVEAPLCKTQVATKSLFKPVDKCASVSSHTKGNNELLASLWKERQQRSLCSRSIDSSNSLEMQEDKRNGQENSTGNTVTRNYEKENLSKCTSNSTSNNSAASVDGEDTSHQSSWTSIGIAENSAHCAQSNSFDCVQTNNDFMKSEHTKDSKRLYEFMEEMKQKLDRKQIRRKTMAGTEYDHNKEGLCRMNQSSSSGYKH
ncbi:hypothetical protein DICVIV_04153 [Dictyocaulus viviparus]|uniref:Uncharacterized protein n=1 Tax=Dictyocaulus viviparus TaxID=29172 RepID=A0A0D8Y0S7_DICVI|nr:hypothetical protein DICVIV_04153 [Dictyocaulus viviparus]